MTARVHLWIAETLRTACGRSSTSVTTEPAAVTCQSCLKQAEIRARSPKPTPPVPAPRWHSFYSKVVGVSHINRNGSSRQAIIRRCSIGEELSLVREPTNPVDPNAIKIVRVNGEQLGYISAYIASDLASDIDKGAIVRCRISGLTGSDEEWRGVNIEISRWTGDGKPEGPPTPVTVPTSSTFSMAALTVPASAPQSSAPSADSATGTSDSDTSRRHSIGIPWGGLVILLTIIALLVWSVLNR